MSDFSWVPVLLWFVVFASSLWPGAEPARPVDKPKKGYWTVATVFWPWRKAYHDLWPHHAVLERGQRSAWLVAFLIAVPTPLIANRTRLSSPGWIMIEIGVVAFFLGRASGFWSADRRIIKAQQTEEPRAPQVERS